MGISNACAPPWILCVLGFLVVLDEMVSHEHSVLPSTVERVAIPTVSGGGNHTREFAAAAATDAAHEACYTVSKALAHVGMRVITDEAFLAQVSAPASTRCVRVG